jgi:purine-cytosine permease-like protein
MAAAVQQRILQYMAIERKSIDYIAENERHGRVIDQVPFWFLGNFHFFTIAIGFVGPSMGLSFGFTSLAGALGILFGTLFVAFHASQGAELGMPQMIQSRAQFGYRGVVVVLFGTLFTFIGFNVADSVLMARGLHGILRWNETAVTLIAAAAAIGIAIYGHDWLHRIFRACFWLCLPLYTLLTAAILAGRVPATHLAPGGFAWVAFIAQFAASAAYNITYAPSVSDYSRYLPRSTRPHLIIAAVFLGATSAAILADLPRRLARNTHGSFRWARGAARRGRLAIRGLRSSHGPGVGHGARGHDGTQRL